MGGNKIGNDGYSPKGLDGLPGDSGHRTHFSSYDLVDDLEIVKELVGQSKALSNNPAFQIYEEYEIGDTILDCYGEIFTITRLSPSLNVTKIADFFPKGEKYDSEIGNFEMYMELGLNDVISRKNFNYNAIRCSNNLNECPLQRLQKNIYIKNQPKDWGSAVCFTTETVNKIKGLLTNSPVKLSFIFKCGLTKEVVYNIEKEVGDKIFIENEYIDMCGYMTCAGSRETVKLNDSYLKNPQEAEEFFTAMKNISGEISYQGKDFEDLNNTATEYCAPLIFGYNFSESAVNKPSPEKAMCDAFIEYYVNGKMFSKKIKLIPRP